MYPRLRKKFFFILYEDEIHDMMRYSRDIAYYDSTYLSVMRIGVCTSSMYFTARGRVSLLAMMPHSLKDGAGYLFRCGYMLH